MAQYADHRCHRSLDHWYHLGRVVLFLGKTSHDQNIPSAFDATRIMDSSEWKTRSRVYDWLCILDGLCGESYHLAPESIADD